MIQKPTAEAIRQAADAILRGELVGMPTETVYGIAADALNEEAVRKIFQVKGRPADNPLIVHIADKAMVGELTSQWPNVADALAERFWPGPLTLVVPKSMGVPDIVTGGQPTIALRMPAHPVAVALIQGAGRPLSAPSANPFRGLSPTRVEDIDPEIATALAMILDGGPCEIGIESTVVDCTGATPRILRPGGISRRQIEEVVGPTLREGGGERRSPGMYRKHYSPKTPTRIALRLDRCDAGICVSGPLDPDQVLIPKDPKVYASRLYSVLRELDARGFSEIVIEAPPRTAEWEAIWDRLRRAGGA